MSSAPDIYENIVCLISFREIKNISLTYRKSNPLLGIRPSQHVVAVIFNPDLQPYILSDSLVESDQKMVSNTESSQTIYYTPFFSSTERRALILERNIQDNSIKPLDIELDVSLMTEKELLPMGTAKMKIRKNIINSWQDILIVPKTRTVKGFLGTREKPYWKFKDYPESQYTFENAELKMKVELKKEYRAMKSSICSKSTNNSESIKSKNSLSTVKSKNTAKSKNNKNKSNTIIKKEFPINKNSSTFPESLTNDTLSINKRLTTQEFSISDSDLSISKPPDCQCLPTENSSQCLTNDDLSINTNNKSRYSIDYEREVHNFCTMSCLEQLTRESWNSLYNAFMEDVVIRKDREKNMNKASKPEPDFESVTKMIEMENSSQLKYTSNQFKRKFPQYDPYDINSRDLPDSNFGSVEDQSQSTVSLKGENISLPLEGEEIADQSLVHPLLGEDDQETLTYSINSSIPIVGETIRVCSRTYM